MNFIHLKAFLFLRQNHFVPPIRKESTPCLWLVRAFPTSDLGPPFYTLLIFIHPSFLSILFSPATFGRCASALDRQSGNKSAHPSAFRSQTLARVVPSHPRCRIEACLVTAYSSVVLVLTTSLLLTCTIKKRKEELHLSERKEHKEKECQTS